MSHVKGQRSIAITGGNGFVGTHLQRVLTGYDVTVWDLPDFDVTKPATYANRLRDQQPDWVVHLAAIASVKKSLDKPDLVREVNVEGARRLLEAVAAQSAQTKVLAVSSADIYGEAGSEAGGAPLAELPLNKAKPNNPYAQSKWEMEELIEKEFSDMCIRVRPFPHIGPGQALGFVAADFASQVAAIEAGQQEPIIKVGNLEAARDFTDVRDVVRAYRLLIEKGKMGDVYNIASGQATKIQTILDQLLAMSEAEITVAEDPARLRPVDTPVLRGDATKLRKATGWQPEISLEQSLRDVLSYWRDKVRTS